MIASKHKGIGLFEELITRLATDPVVNCSSRATDILNVNLCWSISSSTCKYFRGCSPIYVINKDIAPTVEKMHCFYISIVNKECYKRFSTKVLKVKTTISTEASIIHLNNTSL